MKDCWSVLIQLILIERFFCDDENLLKSVRKTKIELFNHLLGVDWAGYIFKHHDLLFDVAYIEFDSQQRVKKITLEDSSEVSVLHLNSFPDWSNAVALTSSVLPAKLKIVSSKKLDAISVLAYYKRMIDGGFQPHIHAKNVEPFKGPMWLRKLRKFMRDPALFFMDSKFPLFRLLAKIIMR